MTSAALLTAPSSNESNLGYTTLNLHRHNDSNTIEEPHDSDVFVQYLRDEQIESSCLRCEQRSRGERRAKALTLPFIADHQGNFGRVVIDCCKFAQRHDFAAFDGVRLSKERQSVTVIHGGDKSQKGVGRFWHRRREPKVSCPSAQAAIQFADRTIVAVAQRANAKSALVR